MNLDKREYFVVTRGIALNTSSLFVSLLGEGESWKKADDKEKRFDRSHEGHVYQALEVCDSAVAAICVFDSDPTRYNHMGQALSLNLLELEVMPVTKGYLEALQGKGCHAI